MQRAIVPFFLFLWIQQLSVVGQSKITVSCSDSMAFIAIWKNVQINQVPCLSVSFRENVAGKIPVQLQFPQHGEISINQMLNIKDQMALDFELQMIKGAYKLVLVSESSYSFMEPVPIAPPTTPETTTTPAPDTLQWALQRNELAEYELLKTQLQDQTFESRKLDLMLTYLTTHAINMEQLRYLMSLLSLEDRKLDFLRAAHGKIQDRTKLNEVTEEFLLDKNKIKAAEIIGQ